MKRLTKKQWNARRIFNCHGIAKRSGANLFICYSPAILGRGYSSANWRVVGVGFETEPDEAWYNHGQKTFYVYHRADKEPQLTAAMRWAHQKYHTPGWERDPWGNYHPLGALLLAAEADVPAGA